MRHRGFGGEWWGRGVGGSWPPMCISLPSRSAGRGGVCWCCSSVGRRRVFWFRWGGLSLSCRVLLLVLLVSMHWNWRHVSCGAFRWNRHTHVDAYVDLCYNMLEHIYIYICIYFQYPQVHIICVHTSILRVPRTLVTKGSYAGSDLDGLLGVASAGHPSTERRDFPNILWLCRFD